MPNTMTIRSALVADIIWASRPTSMPVTPRMVPATCSMLSMPSTTDTTPATTVYAAAAFSRGWRLPSVFKDRWRAIEGLAGACDTCIHLRETATVQASRWRRWEPRPTGVPGCLH